jgi:hypothetical protein
MTTTMRRDKFRKNAQVNTSASPIKNTSTRPFTVKRPISQANGISKANGSNDWPTHDDNMAFPQTEVMERLQHEEKTAKRITWTTSSRNTLDDYCTESSRRHFAQLIGSSTTLAQYRTWQYLTLLPFVGTLWTMAVFKPSCIVCLGQGWIPSPSMERDLVKSLWREWQDSSDALMQLSG